MTATFHITADYDQSYRNTVIKFMPLGVSKRCQGHVAAALTNTSDTLQASVSMKAIFRITVD